MGNLVSKYQFGFNFTRDYDVRWVHISLFGRLTATCPQSFEEINMRWHLKRHGSLAHHQFIIVDSSYWPQWRLHLSSHGCTRMRHNYDVGILSLCEVIPDLWAGTRENYIKLKYAADGLPMGWWWIPASKNADTWSEAFSWLRHQMKTFSALLHISAGNSPVPGEIPEQRPLTRSFDVFFDLRLNKRLSEQSRGWWFETLSRPLWRHRNVEHTSETTRENYLKSKLRCWNQVSTSYYFMIERVMIIHNSMWIYFPNLHLNCCYRFEICGFCVKTGMPYGQTSQSVTGNMLCFSRHLYFVPVALVDLVCWDIVRRI